jgi:hypothetical protein
MSGSDQGKSASSTGGPEPVLAAKKTWHKPTYRFERVFETRALTCGKVATASQCQANRKS